MNCKIKTDLGIIWVPQYNPVLGSMKTPGKIFFQILYQDITWPGAPQSRPPSGQASEQPDTSFSPPWKFHRYVSNLLCASFWFTLLYLDSSVHPANAVEFIPEKTQEGSRPVGHLGLGHLWHNCHFHLYWHQLNQPSIINDSSCRVWGHSQFSYVPNTGAVRSEWYCASVPGWRFLTGIK